jgi:hypothetical protein
VARAAPACSKSTAEHWFGRRERHGNVPSACHRDNSAAEPSAALFLLIVRSCRAHGIQECFDLVLQTVTFVRERMRRRQYFT